MSRVSSSRASFWSAGAVVALALWASACPTMVYPLYREHWQLTQSEVAWIFAAYPLALIPVLIVLGDLSDRIGRRLSMLIGLGFELLGVLCFVLAGDIELLLLGRVLMGIGVGLSISPASVSMVEFSAPGREEAAAAAASAVSAVGIALAMLVGGFLTEYAPMPLRLNYIVLAAGIVVAAVFVWRMPRHTRDESPSRWRFHMPSVPRGVRIPFAVGATAFASAFLIGAIVLPAGAQISQQLAKSTNALVTGALLSVFAVCIGLFSIWARRIPVWWLTIVGGALAVLALWLYVVVGVVHSLWMFLLASAVAGIAYAFSYSGGLGVFSRFALPHHRAAMTSGGFLIGYTAQGVGAPLIGAITTQAGLDAALLVGALGFGAVFLLAAVGGAVMQLRAVHPEGERP